MTSNIREQLTKERFHLVQLYDELGLQIERLSHFLTENDSRPVSLKEKVYLQNEVLKYLTLPTTSRSMYMQLVAKGQKNVLRHLLESWCLPEIQTIDEPVSDPQHYPVLRNRTPRPCVSTGSESKAVMTASNEETAFSNYLYDPGISTSKALEYLETDVDRKTYQWNVMSSKDKKAYFDGEWRETSKDYLPNIDRFNAWVLDIFRNRKGGLICCWRRAQCQVDRKRLLLKVHFWGWDKKYDKVLDMCNPVDRLCYRNKLSSSQMGNFHPRLKIYLNEKGEHETGSAYPNLPLDRALSNRY